MSAKEQLPSSLKIFYKGLRTPEIRKEFLALFYYIKKVSDDFDVQISEMEILDIFGLNTQQLPTKGDINKRLFELAKAAAVKARAVGDFNPKVVADATAAFFNKNTTKDQLLYRLRNVELDIQSHHASILMLVKDMVSLQSEISQMETIDTSELFVREMNKIISSNRFEQIFFYPRHNSICCVTKPVNLKYAEVEYSLGQYVIAFNCNEKQFRVYPYRNNIAAENLVNRYHPHVFEAKDICWGNAGASFSDLMAQQKIGELFLIADMILHAYNPDSPVIDIRRFAKNVSGPVVKAHYPSRLYEIPFHIQTLIDWHPDVTEDSATFANWKAKYIDIHNFHYEWPTPEVTESPQLEISTSETFTITSEINTVDTVRTELVLEVA